MLPSSSPDKKRWFLEHLVGTSAVSVFIVMPFAQLASVRSSPGFALFAVLLCILVRYLWGNGPRPSPVPRRLWERSEVIVAVGALGLLAWSMASLFWGIEPQKGSFNIVAVVSALFGTWFLAKQFAYIPHQRLPIVLLLGVLASAISLWLGMNYNDPIREFFGSDHETYDYNRIAISLSLMIWPLCLIAMKSGKFAFFSGLVFISATVAIFAVSESETAKIAVLAGFGAAFAVGLSRHFKPLIGAAMAALVFTMPVLPHLIESNLHHLPQKLVTSGHIEHRLQIWKGMSDLAVQKLFFGWGMKSDSALALSGKAGRHTEVGGFGAVFNSPHNLALELWVNLGLVGIVFVAVILIGLNWRTTMPRPYAAALAGLQASVFSVLLTGSSGFQGWLLTAIGLACVAFLAISGRNNQPTNSN